MENRQNDNLRGCNHQDTRAFDLLAMGETLLRLSPPENERLARGGSFRKMIGGAELNVAAGVSQLGLRTGMVTKLPGNLMGTYARNEMRACGVRDDFVVYDGSRDARLGLYYYEQGAAPRKPQIVYDRKYSSMTKIALGEFPEDMYAAARCFHVTGITMALNENCRDTAVEMIKRFKEHGTLISFDVNFRANLWNEETARSVILPILPYVDVFFCSEKTARLTFEKQGSTEDVMRSFTEEFPISVVATTERVVHSPKCHTFGSTLYEAKSHTFYKEEPYRDIDVVDRIGSGDAYISGVLYGLLSGGGCQQALEFGNAVSALKDTVPGDLPCLSLSEVRQTIREHKDGGGSEMNR